MNYEIKNINGLTVIFAEMPDANSTTMELFVKAGSIYETKQANGLSHFLEHMFFKGGKKYTTPKIVAETVDEFGGEFNAYTGNEYAGYYIKCAPGYVPKALDVLADMMCHAQFPADELEREKGVIIQEIKMYEDMPRSVCMHKWMERYYGDNSFGWSTLGPEDNIKAFTQDDFFKHKEALYTKDNLVLVIAGALPGKTDLENLIGELFATLPETKQLEEPLFPNHLPAEHEAFFDKQTQQNHLIIGAPGFSLHDETKYAASLLTTILGGPMSSRLFQNIREKRGLCYYIGAAHYDNNADGTFWIRAGMEKTTYETGLQAIYDELQTLVDNGITEEELNKAKGYKRGQTQVGIETSDQLASFVGEQYLFTQKIETLENILDKYDAITLDDIKNITHKLSRENLYAYRVQ